jgi:hypothetical protein
MYSGEYDVCDVTLECISTLGKLEKYAWHGGNRTYDSIPHRGQAYFSSLPSVDIHSRVTSQTSYSPEYTTPTQKKS